MSIFLSLVCVLPVLCHSTYVNDVAKDLKVAFYINLEHMPTRRAHMVQQLSAIGLPAHRFSAVDWRQVVRGEFDRDYVKPQGLAPDLFEKPAKEGNGTIACYLSHLQALIQANKQMGPNDLALIMEDDVSVGPDWQVKMQKAVETAPGDWELLKLSGWGSPRDADLMNNSAPMQHPGTQTSEASLWKKFTSMLSQADRDMTFFQMRKPFTEPAAWYWGTLGLGTPHYFYSGTGAYLVRGSAITKIMTHLRSQAIDDMDAMLLSDGTMRFYEAWPHVFDLSGDAFYGPGLHGRKAMDEFDSSGKSTTDLTEPVAAPASLAALGTPASLAVLEEQDRDVQMGVLARGMAVKYAYSAPDTGAPSPAAPFDLGDTDTSIMRRASISDVGDTSIMRRASIKAHDPSQTMNSGGAALKSAIAGTTNYAQGVPPRAAALSALDGTNPKPKPYEHPAWLRKCATIYLDVGSNIGVQVRKLFEPERYPGAPVLDLFQKLYGAPEDRRLEAASNGLCALGFEPNPDHRAHLLELQKNYTARGWNVHFYPYAAWKDEGTMVFDEAIQPSTQDWGAKLMPEMSDKKEAAEAIKSSRNDESPKVGVRTVDLSHFVQTLPPHSVKLMKMDIEGAEYETIWRMLQQRMLCQGTIDMAFFEAHQWGDVTDWKDDRTFAALVKHIQAGECGVGGMPTEVTSLDDESFELDDPEAEFAARAAVELQDRRWKEKIMCGLTLSALVVWLVFYKFKSEIYKFKSDQHAKFGMQMPWAQALLGAQPSGNPSI